MNNTYFNLFDKSNWKQFKVYGVYKITNTVNNKFYIGSASYLNGIATRLNNHKHDLIHNKHHSKYLQNSFNKHGKKNFYVEILEVCLPEECLNKEQYWIDLLKPHYNMLKTAGSPKGTICTLETREKLRNSLNKFYKENPEKLEKLKILWKNKKHITLETRRKMSEAKKNKTIKHLNYTLRTKGTVKPVLLLDLNNNIIKEFSSITLCAKFIKGNSQNICSVLKNKNKTYKNFKFKYKNE